MKNETQASEQKGVLSSKKQFIPMNVGINENTNELPNKIKKKGTHSTIMSNLLSMAKKDIKENKEFVIKSYKEDLEDLENLGTNDTLPIFSSNVNIQHVENIPEMDSEEEYRAFALKPYHVNECSSSNMSD